MTTQKIHQIFTDFLARENLQSKKLLLAVSGGVDSRVLLEVASEICDSKNLAVFHLDHGARATSGADSEFVRGLCESRKIKFFHKKLEKIPKKNRENFWRKSRQNFAKKCAEKFSAARILTAHHATDLVETMIFRLAKGAGVFGLASPLDPSGKPFLTIPKTELEQFARKNNLKFRSDESNTNCVHERNLIRLKILPELRKITPNLEKVFLRESQIFTEIAEFLNRQIWISGSQQIDLEGFLSLPIVLRREYLRKIATRTPSFSEIEDAMKWLENHPPGNSKKTVGGTKLRIFNGKLQWDFAE